jgi:PAS domain S-box-containing protein
MKTKEKTRAQLIEELEKLKKRNTELESQIKMGKPGEWESIIKNHLLENSIDSIFLDDFDGNILYANETAARSIGYSRDELLSLNFRQLMTPEYARNMKRHVKELLKKGYTTFESARYRKDGSIVPIDVYSRLIEKDGQRFIIHIDRDITERKKAEEEIQFRAKLLDSANDSIFVHDLDGNLVYANEAAYKSRGYNKEELMDAHAGKLDQEEYREIIKFRREEVLSQGYGLYETTHEKKDGSKIPLEIHARLIELGGQKYVVNAARDITERKRMEEALADEAVRKRILVDQSRDGIVILDQDGAVYEANRRFAEMLGYSQEEVNHLSVWDWEFLFPPEQVREMIRSVDESGDHFETVHRRKDGTTYDVEISTNAATYAGEKLIFCVCRDITERKRAEKEREHLLEDIQKINIRIEESNKELQDFAYIASHDLREPLRKIISFGSLLEESLGEKLDKDERENFEFMMEGSNRMQTMIDDLLTYSRITTKAKPFEQVDLNDVIEDVKKLELAERLESTGGVIIIPKPLPYVYGDQSQLHQILQNLIGNGLKFHKDNIPPEIIIRAHNVDNNMLMVELQDNGIGIDERYKEQIFTMFKRLHSRAKYEGTGIGLAACKKIVTRHGGTIGVSSKMGEGSLFWFTLPKGSYVKD